ncbi:tRNA-YW synthesizing protein, putative [Plasmodium ovale]|uniref:tRNA 4-demethylwyosine synthase (AdoMet-dependent) n=2 Tax=Plasmodium ovale TaxID=36330 RepID=A0A1A8VUW1_PLAOA|nr:hypothetical protein POVCU2_0025270 [Plasmodium ovale curtisi]SCQ16416.1 tRNA-YW synthesizing protein, putative [Plasmodium ovale]
MANGMMEEKRLEHYPPLRPFQMLSIRKKAKINFKVIYGSESGGTYKRAKEFLNELVEFFREIGSFFKDINRISLCGDNADGGSTNGCLIDTSELGSRLVAYFKSYLMEKEKNKAGLSRESRGKRSRGRMTNGETQHLDIFKNGETESNEHFANCVDIFIENSISTVHIDFTSGNEFDSYSFFENSQEYDLNILLLLLSTCNYGSFPKNCYKIEEILRDLLNDFRVGKNYLENVFYSCVGFGNKQYGSKHFCAPIKECDKILTSLGAHKLYKTVKLCDEEDNDVTLLEWKSSLFKTLSLSLFFYHFDFTKLRSNYVQYAMKKVYNSLKYYCSFFCEKDERDSNGHGEKVLSEVDVSFREESDGAISPNVHVDENKKETIPTNATDEIDSKRRETFNCGSGDEVEDILFDTPKDMLSINQREKLTKEGYKIIGSHSAVKLCRWTKSQLRGRGGCYKHTFYGINSYQCMETTPSLACANKCVFCWRHHKNPVGTQWKWHKDDANMIVEEAIKKHRGMIKELKGVYGIIKERYDNAMNVKHCALSLVGEPIMYPDINQLIDELHKRNISTFLVTNAQFPSELKKLHKVTQLYISIDGPNRDALKNIDRPLFKDFWERYIKCIKLLKKRKERTVFRFTLVKEYNMMSDEILSYAKLVEYGLPDFIEIKAVTYCGSSEGYKLTMKNIPWHEEVYNFAHHLINCKSSITDAYDIACEHKHSCSILIAKKIFKINNKWHTWINYENFQLLVKQGKDFTSTDYCAETPHWAVVGAQECGFNPSDKRVYTKGRNKNRNPDETQRDSPVVVAPT